MHERDTALRDSAEPLITVDQLVKRYRRADINAIDGISFTVFPGEFFALLGPNGAGKTTTISILTTTLLPSAGRVSIAGADVARDSATVRRRVGIVFQQPSLDLNLTAEENVRLHAILYGLFPYRPTFHTMPGSYRERLRDLAAVVGLSNEMFTPVKKFSGGMRRKLEIVRSLMHHPQILFLDEPTAGLDTDARRNLWQYLQEVRSSARTTIVLTTHYLEEAEQADRVCIMSKGKVVSLGAVADVKKDIAHDVVHIDAEDRNALRLELEKLNVPFTEYGGFDVTPQTMTTHQLLKSINTPLTEITTRTPTLEDAYLKILERAA